MRLTDDLILEFEEKDLVGEALPAEVIYMPEANRLLREEMSKWPLVLKPISVFGHATYDHRRTPPLLDKPDTAEDVLRDILDQMKWGDPENNQLLKRARRVLGHE